MVVNGKLAADVDDGIAGYVCREQGPPFKRLGPKNPVTNLPQPINLLLLLAERLHRLHVRHRLAHDACSNFIRLVSVTPHRVDATVDPHRNEEVKRDH